MLRDPALMNDSTGEGITGTDAGIEAQNRLRTIYNGTTTCASCPATLTPHQVLYSKVCSNCSREKSHKLVKKRMTR